MDDYRFDFLKLDVFHVLLEALVRGDAIARRFPRGYGVLADQLRRALAGAYGNFIEATSRTGADRLARFRAARGEASEAAGFVIPARKLRLAPEDECDAELRLLDRACAMLTRLAHLGS